MDTSLDHSPGDLVERFRGDTGLARFLVITGVVTLIGLPSLGASHDRPWLSTTLGLVAGLPAILVGGAMLRIELRLHRHGLTFRGFRRRIALHYRELDALAIIKRGELRVVLLELKDGRAIPLRGLANAARAARRIAELKAG